MAKYEAPALVEVGTAEELILGPSDNGPDNALVSVSKRPTSVESRVGFG